MTLGLLIRAKFSIPQFDRRIKDDHNPSSSTKDDFKAYYDLRIRVLRAPGASLSHGEMIMNPFSQHFMALDDDKEK